MRTHLPAHVLAAFLAFAGTSAASAQGKPPFEVSVSGHLGAQSVAFSPDGSRVLSAGNKVQLWDAMTGALLRTFQGHSSRAAFSPDGSRVLSASSNDHTLKLWDAASGALLHTFEWGSYALRSTAFSPDGTRVLSGNRDQRLQLRDAATGGVLLTFEGRANGPAAFSADGSRVLSSNPGELGRQTLKLWDAITGALLRTIEEGSYGVNAVVFSPDGARILSSSYDRDLKLWDAATGALLRTLGPGETVSSVAISPDGARVVSTSGTVKQIWDMSTGALLHTYILSFPNGFSSAAYSSDGARIVSGSSDGLRIWNAGTGQLLATLVAGPDDQWLAITPQGFFAAGWRDRELLTLGQRIFIRRGPEFVGLDQVHQSLFNPDLVREALLRDPNGEVHGAATQLNLEKVVDSGPAPLVEILPRPGASQSSSDVVTLKARITDSGKGIGRIEWRVNGITTTVAPKLPGSGREFVVSQSLALDAGDNVIEVVAYNASNLLASGSARTTVKFTEPASKTRPKLHLLVIGIDKYSDENFAPPLDLAENDAKAFAGAMKAAAAGLYSEVRVIQALGKAATRDNLHRIVATVAAQIHPRDSFILFAAGHGVSSGGQFYLIPQDYQSGTTSLAAGAIGQDQLQDWLANRIKARKAIILLDTCESGALVAGHRRSRVGAPASEAAVGRLHEATGRPVLTAAAAGQFANEGLIGTTGERRGVFTWAVLDALRKGDANGNGLIELSELVGHVQSVVPKVAAEMGGEGEGRAAAAAGPVSDRQTARFGSRGEDFVVARRLQ